MTRGPIDARSRAEATAALAFSFLAEETARIDRFLSVTGLAAKDLHTVAEEASFLRGVLDHLVEDEALLIAFCEAAGLTPQDIWSARRALGALPTERG